jgi:hypothetical protein
VGSGAPLNHTLEFALLGDAWAPSVGAPGAPTTALLESLRSAQNEPWGWNNVVLPALTADNVERRSDTLVVVTLPISPNYSILKPETLRITLPAVTLRSEAEINISSALSMPEWARWAPVDVHPIILYPDVGRVTMTTALSHETDLQTLGLSKTIALSIEGDTWAPEVGLFGHPINAELVRGFTSTSIEASSWTFIARETLAFLATSSNLVTRVNDTDVHVQVPFLSGYEIEVPESITLTVPGAAVLTNQTMNATSGFVIMPTPGNCILEGTLLAAGSVGSLRTLSLTLRLRLIGDRFRVGSGGAAGGLTDEDARALLGSIRSQQNEPTGWNAVIRSALLSGPLTGRIARLERNVVEITLPPHPTYMLTAPETLMVELPGSVLQSQRDLAVAVVATPPLVIRTTSLPGGVMRSVRDLAETDVRSNFTLHLVLSDDTWSNALGTDFASTQPLVRAVRSLQDEPLGFNALIQPSLTWRSVSVHSGTELRIAFEGAPSLNLLAPETVVLVLPASTLTSGQASRHADGRARQLAADGARCDLYTRRRRLCAVAGLGGLRRHAELPQRAPVTRRAVAQRLGRCGASAPCTAPPAPSQ